MGATEPVFTLRRKYFSKATLARWTHLPSFAQVTVAWRDLRQRDERAPVSPKSARQIAFQVRGPWRAAR